MRATGLTAGTCNPQWWMGDMGQQLFQPPDVSGWRPNKYWLPTSRLWSRANFARSVIWRNNTGNMLSPTASMTVPDAITYAFNAFGITDVSAHTRAKLEAWLTAQRADGPAWDNWSFINLLTLVMLSPECNLA
jgi:hypothetical protein